MPNVFDQFDQVEASSGNIFDQFDTPTKPKEEGSDFTRGIKESFQQLPQLGYGVMAGVGAAAESALGEGGIATGIKKAGVRGYEEWGDKIAKEAKESDSWSYSYDRAKEGDFGALVDWLQHGLGYVGGQGVQALASAGLGAVGGKLAAGTIAKQVAEGMVAKEAAKLAAEGVAAGQVGKLATAQVAAKFATIGQNVALGGMAVGQEGGEIFGDLSRKSVEENRALTGAELGKAFATTLAAGGLEFVGDRLGLDVVMGKSSLLKPAAGMTGITGRAARGGIAAAGAIPIEAGTEYAQTLLEEAGKGNDPFSEEAFKQAKDAAALGALGGTVIGGAGGAMRGAKQPDPQPGPLPSILQAPDVDSAINAAQAALSEPADLLQSQPQDPLLAAMREREVNPPVFAPANDAASLLDRQGLGDPLAPMLEDRRARAEAFNAVEAEAAQAEQSKAAELDAIPEQAAEQNTVQAALSRAGELEAPTAMQLALERARAAPAPAIEPEAKVVAAEATLPRVVERTEGMVALPRQLAEQRAAANPDLEVVRFPNIDRATGEPNGKFAYTVTPKAADGASTEVRGALAGTDGSLGIDAGTGVATGLGTSGNAGPAVDAGRDGDQSAGGAVPLATWFGRRGDGYVTREDAAMALPSRQRVEPDLSWKIEPMPTGKFRLAGYAQQEGQSGDGTVATTAGLGSNDSPDNPSLAGQPSLPVDAAGTGERADVLPAAPVAANDVDGDGGTRAVSAPASAQVTQTPPTSGEPHAVGLSNSRQRQSSNGKGAADRIGADAQSASDISDALAGSKQVARGADVPGDTLQLPTAQVAQGDAAQRQAVVDGGLGDAKFLSNLVEGESFRKQGLSGLDIPSQRAVLTGVLNAISDRKVLNRVVQLIPIDVVNQLAGQQLTTEELLHNPTVLQDALAAFAEKQDKQAREQREIASRQDASAENFELGQDANDSISGQAPMFAREGVTSGYGTEDASRKSYEKFVSLLPPEYRNDPHRRDPAPVRDARATAALWERLQGINAELRGPDDKKGHGPITYDQVGNLVVDARDTTAAAIVEKIVPLADELDMGLYVTGAASGAARLQDAGFVSESGMGVIAQRLMKFKPQMPSNVYIAAPGTIMSYRPRGFSDVLFKRGPTQSTGLTRSQFSEAMAQAFGAKVAERLEKNGVVIPLEDQSTLPAHVVPFVRSGDQVYGFYDQKTDRTYAVLSNLTPEMVKGLALHEIGVHYGFEAMLGKDKYTQVINRIKVLGKAGNVQIKAALAQAKKESVSESQVPEETLAYLVTNNPEMGLVQEVIAKIKAFVFDKFGIGGKYLTADDMTMLARAAVLHSSRTQPGSRRPDFAAFNTSGDGDANTRRADDGRRVRGRDESLRGDVRANAADGVDVGSDGHRVYGADRGTDGSGDTQGGSYLGLVGAGRRGAQDGRNTGASAFARADQQPGRSNTDGLNQQLASQLGDKWSNAYAMADIRATRQNGVAKAIKSAFGVEVVAMRATADRFNDMAAMQFRGKLYINITARGNHGFVQLAGHELLHDLKRTSPQAYAYFADQASNYIARGGVERYQEYLDGAAVKTSPDTVKEELLADFTGDAFADPKFLEMLAQDDPSKFRVLVRAVTQWLREVADKLTAGGFGSSQYFKDVDGLRRELADVLQVYAEDRRNGGTTEVMASRKGVGKPSDLEVLQRFWSARTWDSEAEARDMIRRRILDDNERYPMFKPQPAALADQLEFTRAAKGQVKIKMRRESDAANTPNPIGSEEDFEGDVPDVDWNARDMQGDRDAAGVMKAYGRGKGRVYRAWIDIGALPIAKGEDITDGVLDDNSGARQELEHRGAPPPLKVKVGARGKVELMDGNHRLAYWRGQGYDMVPAYVIDERAEPTNESPAPNSDGATKWGAQPGRGIITGTMAIEPEEPLFSRSVITGQTNRTYSPEQQRAMRNVGFEVDEPSLKERAQALWQDAGKKMAQGIVDQFAPVKDLDKTAYGLLRLAKGATGAFESFLRGGQLKLTDGVYDFDDTKRGGVVDKLLIPLQGEHHDFFRWIAANRAERLKTEGKEHLFSDQDIIDLKSLASGTTSFNYTMQTGPQAGSVTRDRTKIYADSQRVFNVFNDNILDMAEQSGLIDAASRKLWSHEFYVPFYRVADDADGGVRGMNIKGGIVRQQAFKQLKGGKNALNADLLDNTLMNWAHLLDAAAKNRGAKATLEAAERMGVAIGAPQYTANQIGSATGNKNGVVWFMDGGQKRYFVVDDPYVLTAINSLEYAGMRNPVMNAMSYFKHALTVGVTASPFFKVRNLIRDSVQVIGTSSIGINPLSNVAEGWKLTDPKSDAYFQLLAGGGTIHFGTMLEGSEAKRVQALVESGVDDATILNSDHKVKAFYRKFIEPGITAYNELGNRGEAVNRASLYAQLKAQGMNHAEASLQARDLMDFSMQGSFTSIRFLTQVVPFANARMQGLYKLGRAAKEDPARFSAVLGATALFSLALLAAYSDDDDWKKREEWDRQNFWWFKFGGTAFRIPKPFEIGAIATLAEHGAELIFDDEMTGKRFRQAVVKLLGDNLSMNPVPQLVKPILDVYANKNSFSGRPIETMGMERLKSEYRFTDRTSMTARAASTGLNAVTGLVGAEALSPVQIDSMIRGYFGWLGAFIVGAGDVAMRPATGQAKRPTPDYWKTATGGMISDTDSGSSRYVSQMYEQARAIEQAYGTWRALQKEGKTAEAKEFFEDNKADLIKYRRIEGVKRGEAKLNERIRMIERSNMVPDQKRDLIRTIREQQDRLARLGA